MATYFTADTHLGHKNIIEFCNRPYADIEEHDEALIRNWNARVGENDDVYHLGDFAYRCHPRKLASMFHQLNGRKHLILGNHDMKGPVLGLPWASTPVPYAELTLDGTRLVLFHYGQRVWNQMRRGSIHLYGHSHGRLPGVGNSLDVGVDVWGYRPVTLDEIRARIATHPPVGPAEGEADA